MRGGGEGRERERAREGARGRGGGGGGGGGGEGERGGERRGTKNPMTAIKRLSTLPTFLIIFL